MITKFKLFESINDGELEIGDYVICKEMTNDVVINSFMSNNIGVFVSFSGDYKFEYNIQYENIPIKIINYFTNNTRFMSGEEIVCFSKDINELELILATNKFNI